VNEKIYTYTFFGRVFPERANVYLKELKNVIKWNNTDIDGVLSINSSQIMAQYKCNLNIEDIYTFKNDIEEHIRFMVDIIGYNNGCGYDVEIISCIDSLDRQIVFGVAIDNIEEFSKKRLHNINDLIFKISSSEYQIYFRRCLADLREAIRSPKDTVFFCYRGIESLRQYFVEKYNLDEKNSWEKLRDELGVERKKIDDIKNFADPVRHGNGTKITSKERYDIVISTWEVVDNFIEYALKNII